MICGQRMDNSFTVRLFNKEVTVLFSISGFHRLS